MLFGCLGLISSDSISYTERATLKVQLISHFCFFSSLLFSFFFSVQFLFDTQLCSCHVASFLRSVKCHFIQSTNFLECILSPSILLSFFGYSLLTGSFPCFFFFFFVFVLFCLDYLFRDWVWTIACMCLFLSGQT